jgi:hypothetical protein
LQNSSIYASEAAMFASLRPLIVKAIRLPLAIQAMTPLKSIEYLIKSDTIAGEMLNFFQRIAFSYRKCQ